MDAIQLINQHIDVEMLLWEYKFIHIQLDGNVARACCKIHGGNNPSSFVINKENGLWYCHTGCGGGDVFTLIQKIDGISFPEAVRKAAQLFATNIDGLSIVERKPSYLVDLQRFMQHVQRFRRPAALVPYELGVETRVVTKFRSFQAETLEKFKIGYVDQITLAKRDEAEYVLRNRLTIPILQGGVQVGVSLRRVNNNDFPKWSHQPAYIKTREMLYNYDNAKHESPFVITEGIFDVWAFDEIGVPAVATFGSHITDEQYSLIMKTGSDLVMAFDGDDAGKKGMMEAANRFKYKANVKYVVFDEGEDPESIPRKELMERYEAKRNQYST